MTHTGKPIDRACRLYKAGPGITPKAKAVINRAVRRELWRERWSALFDGDHRERDCWRQLALGDIEAIMALPMSERLCEMSQRIDAKAAAAPPPTAAPPASSSRVSGCRTSTRAALIAFRRISAADCSAASPSCRPCFERR